MKESANAAYGKNADKIAMCLLSACLIAAANAAYGKNADKIASAGCESVFPVAKSLRGKQVALGKFPCTRPQIFREFNKFDSSPLP